LKTQPLAGLHESVVQTLSSLQATAVPPPHVPPEQTSLEVQALPSEQLAPSAFAVCTQAPVVRSHAAVWHESTGAQGDAQQMPEMQLSLEQSPPLVQAAPVSGRVENASPKGSEVVPDATKV